MHKLWRPVLIASIIFILFSANANASFYDDLENAKFVYNGQNVKITSSYTEDLSNFTVYKGNLHSHSTESDGYGTPAIVMEQYRDHGYDFNSITDHDKVTQDPLVAGITFISGIEERAKDTGWPKGTGDIGRIGAIVSESSNLSQTILNTGISENNYNDLKHPNRKNNGFFNADLDKLNNFHALEVWNGNNQLNAEIEWDYLLSQERKIFGDSADDLHKLNGPHMFEAWTRVFSESNNAEQIKNNLIKGNSYFGYTPSGSEDILLDININKNLINVELSLEADIEWIINNGVVVQTDMNTKNAEYSIIGNEKYIRIRASKNGAKVFSQPIFINLENIENIDVGQENQTIIIDNTHEQIVNISKDFSNTMLDFSKTLSSDFTVTSPKITINSTTNLSDSPIMVHIADGTKIIGNSNWNGSLSTPQFEEKNSVHFDLENGYPTIFNVIHIGSFNTAIRFDKSVRILVPDQSSQYVLHVGYFENEVFKEIVSICESDAQSVNDNLPNYEACKMFVGDDLIIWTKHFTKFVTYIQNISSNSGSTSNTSSVKQMVLGASTEATDQESLGSFSTIEYNPNILELYQSLISLLNQLLVLLKN